MRSIFSWALTVAICSFVISCVGGPKVLDTKDELLKTPPEIQYDRLNVPKISLEEVELEHYFKVKNVSAVPLAVTAATYKYVFMDKTISEKNMPLTLSVPPNSEGEFVIKEHVDFPKEYEALKAVTSKKEGVFHITGKIMTAAGEYPIEVEGDIMLPIIPYLKIDSASVSKDSKDQMSMGFELIVANENPFKVYAEYIDFEMFVEGKSVKKDKILMGEKVSSPGFGYPIEAIMHPDNLGKDLIKKVMSASTLNYQLKGTFKLENFSIPVDISGSYTFTR